MSHPGTFTTPKGTILYLMDIKGKPYLPVQERIIWFREEHPKARIASGFVSITDTKAVAWATIYDESGTEWATAHKNEDVKGFADFIEKSQTGAVGRALALCGYGTQFTALEFEEGMRLADAPSERGTTALDLIDQKVTKPVKPAFPPLSPGDHEIRIGKKYIGHKIKDVHREDLWSFMQWIHTKADEKFRAQAETQEFLFYAENYLNSIDEDTEEINELDLALKRKIKDERS